MPHERHRDIMLPIKILFKREDDNHFMNVFLNRKVLDGLIGVVGVSEAFAAVFSGC